MQAFIPQKDAIGCIVPNFIFYHKELSNGAKMLYTILGSYARAKDFCYPSKSTLSTKLNCSINTLKSWLKQLIYYGFITIKQTVQGEIFYLFSPSQTESQSSKIDSEAPKLEKQSSETDSEASKIDNKASKIDTKVNIKNFNIIKTPSIPQKNMMPKKHQGGDNYKINQEFETIWEAYPRKEAKEPARSLWFSWYRNGKIPSLEVLKSAIQAFSQTYSWQREQGRFTPQLVNFIRGMRWKDIESPKTIESPQLPLMQVTAPVYQLRQQETQANDKPINRIEIDKIFSRFRTFFEPMNKIDECLSTVFFDNLYSQGKIPIVHEKQTVSLVAFLKNLKGKG